mgnify:CR=1 FL=1
MLEVLEDSTTTTVEIYPDTDASYISSATAVAYSPTGGELSSESVTADSVSTTLVSASGSTYQTLIINSASGVAVGRSYRLSNAEGESEMVTVETLDGTTVTLLDPPGMVNAPAAGDAFRGARVSWTLPAAATATRGTNHRILWRVTRDDAQVRSYSSVYHVVRTTFRAPVTHSDVYAYVARIHPGSASQMTPEHRRDVADRANDRVRARLMETKRYPHLVGDPDALREAGRVALQWCLLDERHLLISNDEDLLDQLAALDGRITTEVNRAVDAMTWIDIDDSNSSSIDEVGPVSTRIVL